MATYESSLYNEDGSKREDFALADLFGVHYTGESLATGNDYYFKIKNPDSPILKGITGTELLMNSGKTAISTVVCDEDRVANYLPLIANQPPEYAWPKEWDSPYAGIVARSYGRGKVVYFAHTIDELCYTNGHEDFTEVYANAVDYVTGGDYSLSTDAYRSVHTNLIVTARGRRPRTSSPLSTPPVPSSARSRRSSGGTVYHPAASRRQAGGQQAAVGPCHGDRRGRGCRDYGRPASRISPASS